MIFKRLVLKNFKSHEHTVIDFNKGITVVVGENGAGKSSVLEGISFALFKLHTSQKTDNLIRNNTNEMNVELEFYHEGNDYKIIRRVTKGTKSSLFKKEDKEYVLLYKGESDVQKAIQDILRMDSTLFSNAIYIRQGEIAELINKSVTQKKNFIGKLLGIDSLEKSWKMLGSVISEQEKDLAQLNGKLSTYEDIDNQYKTMILELQRIKKENIKINNLLEETQQKIKSLEEKKQEQEDIKAKREPLLLSLEEEKKSLEKLLQKKEEIEEFLEKANDTHIEIETLEEEIKELSIYPDIFDNLMILKMSNEKINILNNDLENEKKRKALLIEECKGLWEESIHSEFDIENLKNDIEISKQDSLEFLVSLMQKAKKLERRNAILNNKIEEIEESKINLLNASDKCPICQTQLSEDLVLSLLEEYEEQIEKAQVESQKNDDELSATWELKEETDVMIKTLEDIDNKRLILQDMDKKILSLENKINNTKNEIKEFDNEDMSIDEVKEKIDLLESLKNNLAQLKGSLSNEDYFKSQKNEIESNIEESSNKISTTLNDISNLRFDEKKYKDIVDEYNLFSQEINKLQKRKYNIEGRVKEQINYIKNLIQEKNTYSKLQLKYDGSMSFNDLLKKIRLLYSKDGIQKDLRNISKPLIEKYTKDFFNEFNFNYSDLTIDEDYNVDIYGPEGISSSVMISGGEKIAIALALRLGISKAISNSSIETIVLDEPTIHLDSSRIYELVNLFGNLSFLSQMIIVTHENQLENVADNLIKIKKQNGVSYLDIDVDQ